MARQLAGRAAPPRWKPGGAAGQVRAEPIEHQPSRLRPARSRRSTSGFGGFDRGSALCWFCDPGAARRGARRAALQRRVLPMHHRRVSGRPWRTRPAIRSPSAAVREDDDAVEDGPGDLVVWTFITAVQVVLAVGHRGRLRGVCHLL
jgi:hypothetical protein